MNNRLPNLGLSLILCFLSITIFAQKAQWSLSESRSIDSKEEQARVIVPNDYKVFEINYEQAVSQLKNTIQSKAISKRLFSLPMPDGSLAVFEVEETSVFEKGLQDRYPNIRSFTGHKVDDRQVVAKFGYSQKGFHAMIMTPGKSRVFIDPYATTTNNKYISYYKKDYDRQHEFSCGTETSNVNTNEVISQRAGDCQLRTYRLALACTGEYATYHGGTITSVLAEYNIAMTRINGIYETDLGITMILIANTDELIFLNGNSDPYTNNNGGTMLGENQSTIDNIIGDDGYDIGHVFSTGGGGIARLQSPCNNGIKAQGVTGLGAPVNDPFYVDYVCHEIGHQFGANHTQNNSCQRNTSTSMEVGSANTIMGYAGICAPNSQGFSDDHFHAVSIAEIANNVVNGSGGSCGITTTTDNNAPTINQSTTSFNVPIATPFVLTAEAEDTDGDALTYCWEQYDNEIATMPPLTTNTQGPAFISKSPVSSPARYFPSLNNILTNTNPEWEVIPFVSREMNFRCTVRDNNSLVGCTAEDDLVLNFHSEAGPFLVETPNTNVTWSSTDIEDVIWDVAGTDAAPISCANVDILISTDGGLTYEIIVAENIPNTGMHTLTVPDIQTDKARLMVRCSDNVFFDISDTDFSITTPFTVALSSSSVVACVGDDASIEINTLAFQGFTGTVDLAVDGLPGTTTATFGANPLTVTESTVMDIININGAPGTYTATLTATGTDITLTKTFDITIQPSSFTNFALLTPNDGQQALNTNGVLDWTALDGILNYNIEIATDYLFTNVVYSANEVSASSINYSGLLDNTVYYWRAKANTICTDDAFTEVFAFQTQGINCNTYLADNLPLEISIPNASVVTSTLRVQNQGNYNSITCYIGMDHTWIGDIKIDLSTPSGTSLSLVDQIGIPGSNFGCDADNLYTIFSDASINSAAQLEGACGTYEDSYQSITPFSSIEGEVVNGLWELTVEDFVNNDGGALNNFYLEFCEEITVEEVNLQKDILYVNKGLNRTINESLLNAPESQAANTIYTITTLPSHGTIDRDILLDGNYTVMTLGSSFSQRDINDGKMRYQHNGNTEVSDNFRFDVLTNEFSWAHNEVFEIVISQEAFVGTALTAQNALCFGEANGSIYAEVIGGIAPYEYSLDGINYQSDNTFNGIGVGTYTITIKDASQSVISSNPVNVAQPEPITLESNLDLYNLVINAEGGNGDYQYSIDQVTYQADNTFLDLPNGTYTIYAKDTNDCIGENTFTIDIAALSFERLDAINTLCPDDMSGALDFVGMGGISPYVYSLDGSNYSEQNNYTSLAIGSYDVYVKDAGGKVYTESVTIAEPDPIVATPTINMTEATIDVIGGTAPYEFSIDASNYTSDNLFSFDNNGNYTIYVRDANACLTLVTLEITAVPVSAVAAVNDAVCFGGDSGFIIVSASNGVMPYEYSLNSVDYQSSNQFDNLNAGTYIAYVKDANGVVFEINNLVVAQPNAIAVTATSNGLEITIIASGGTGALEYSIDGGASFQSNNVFTTTQGGGSYDIVVRDANGCIDGNNETLIISSLDDIANTFGASLYPNPVMNIVTLQFDGSQNELLNIQILDSAGRLIKVLNTAPNDNSLQIDMTAFDSGVYHMVISNGDKRASTRIIKI